MIITGMGPPVWIHRLTRRTPGSADGRILDPTTGGPLRESNTVDGNHFHLIIELDLEQLVL